MSQPLPATGVDAFTLTAAQRHYFDTFGFLALRGLFRNEIDRIIRGFEAVFADEAAPRWDTHHELHFERARSIIPVFIDRSPDLVWLRDDPRVVGIVRSLIGARYEDASSDGNLFSCDSSWHPDSYGAPMTRYHLKLSFYLDPLREETGAIRMIPGTNFYESEFAQRVRVGVDDPGAISDVFGVGVAELPSWTIESDPGDVIVWNYRTIHASFGGMERRRLFSMSFREV